jgi:hypothetical protein
MKAIEDVKPRWTPPKASQPQGPPPSRLLASLGQDVAIGAIPKGGVPKDGAKLQPAQAEEKPGPIKKKEEPGAQPWAVSPTSEGDCEPEAEAQTGPEKAEEKPDAHATAGEKPLPGKDEKKEGSEEEPLPAPPKNLRASQIRAKSPPRAPAVADEDTAVEKAARAKVVAAWRNKNDWLPREVYSSCDDDVKEYINKEGRRRRQQQKRARKSSKKSSPADSEASSASLSNSQSSSEDTSIKQDSNVNTIEMNPTLIQPSFLGLSCVGGIVD